MYYSEKCKAKAAPLRAFLAVAGILVGVVLLFNLLRFAQYRLIGQLAILALAIYLIYLLYRYALTEHTYTISDGCFTVKRGSGMREQKIAELAPDMVIFCAPSDYAGDRLPKGEFSPVNACSSRSGFRTGLSIYCRTDDITRGWRLCIDPSPLLLQHLTELFGEEKFSKKPETEK